MHLSPVYNSVAVWWGMIYHTQPDSEEVEFVTHKLFTSKSKALKWFGKKHKPHHFIQPEAVQITIKYVKVEGTT